MKNGTVINIFTCPEPGDDMSSVDSVIAVAGRGLIGDRYYSLSGGLTDASIKPDQEITLIETAAFERLYEEHGIKLEYAQSRRNVVTSGVDLNSLVDKTFQVGDVQLTGLRFCEPCTYLSGLTGHPNLVKLWRRQAGLRACIDKGGRISVGDQITI